MKIERLGPVIQHPGHINGAGIGYYNLLLMLFVATNTTIATIIIATVTATAIITTTNTITIATATIATTITTTIATITTFIDTVSIYT